MDGREKFLKIAHFELSNFIFNSSWHQWFWDDAIKRWLNEGASYSISSIEHRKEYLI